MFDGVAGRGLKMLEVRAGVVGLENVLAGPVFDHIENLRVGEIAVQVVLAATVLRRGWVPPVRAGLVREESCWPGLAIRVAMAVKGWDMLGSREAGMNSMELMISYFSAR